MRIGPRPGQLWQYVGPNETSNPIIRIIRIDRDNRQQVVVERLNTGRIHRVGLGWFGGKHAHYILYTNDKKNTKEEDSSG